MREDKKEGVFRKALKGMRSMTLLAFLFVMAFFLFPRFMIFITLIVSIPFLRRLLPKIKKV